MENAKNHPINDLMNVTMQKIRDMIDVNTIIGNPITTPDGVTIIPVSKVSFGFGTGGSDFATKTQTQGNSFGGGGGAGVNIVPVSFLIIKGDNVRLLPVGAPPSNTADRVIELVPEIIDKISAMMDKKKDENTCDTF